MREMRSQEVLEFLTANRFGVLGLADGARAYALPIFYAFDGKAIYMHTRRGLKTRYARATEEACFTVVRVQGLDDWASVQVFGRVVEMGDEPDRIEAHMALMRVPLPPEWGESLYGEPSRSDERVVTYRLVPERMSGRYSVTPGDAAQEREIAFKGM